MQWMPWCLMFFYIDTNGNQSCLHALQLWSVWGFHQTTLSRLHKLLILTIPDKLETMIVGAMMSNVLIYRYKCKWIMHRGSPAMISMRVPANNPLWIAQISNFGFFDAIADKDETLMMDTMMSNVQCPMSNALQHRYKCKWIMLARSLATISMRVPPNNPLWIAQIADTVSLYTMAHKVETIMMDSMM